MTSDGTSARASDDPMIGLVIADRYRVRALLGEGGMGMVYEGVHEELGRPVAIKVLRPAWASDPDAIERFFREARAASGLGHPNICDVYDLGRLGNGRPFMVMPKLEGDDLSQLLEREGPMSPSRVAELLRGPANALDVIHAKGMVHRDIKPENMFASRLADGSEIVRVVDFGLATLLVGGDPRLTREGLVCGTPIYLAPEATQGALPDQRGDVYALAVVAYELIAGVPPLDNPSPFALLTMKLTQEAPPLSSKTVRPISIELDRVLAKGLALDPAYRYRTAGELVRALAVAAAAAPTRDLDSSSGMRKHTHEMSWMDMIDDGDVEAASFPLEETRHPDRSGAMMASVDSPPAALPRRVHRAVFFIGALMLVGAGAVGGSVLLGDAQSTPHRSEVGSDDTTRSNAQATTPLPPDTTAFPEEVESAIAAPAPSPDTTEVRIADPVVAPSPREPARTARHVGRNDVGSTSPVVRNEGTSAIERVTEPVAQPAHPTSRVGEGDVPSVPGRDRERARGLERDATSALTRGMLPHAIELYRDATQADPGYAPSWRGLGIANERLGRAVDARRAYERYLRLAPSAADADAIRRRVERL